ncbi:MAG: dTMP kinase [bacterium]
MSTAGRLIAFEGPEGAGKSTQMARAATALRGDGRLVEATFEPGATALGIGLRETLLHARAAAAPAPLAELFLYLADRAQHVRQVIAPALAAGAVVLTDRFSASTIAYQGYGRGLDLERVTQADAWARDGMTPRLTVLLDLPVRVGLARAHGDDDRFHAEDVAFHERVRGGFHRLAAADPETWRVIDATQPADAVHAQVMAALRDALEGA